METWRDYRRRIVNRIGLTSYLSSDDDFLLYDESRYSHEDVSSLSSTRQQELILEDLKVIFTGFPGDLIKYNVADRTVHWTINPSIDASLKSRLYVDNCLPLAAYLILVRHDVSILKSDVKRGTIVMSVAVFISDFVINEIESVVAAKDDDENRQLNLSLFNFLSRMQSFEDPLKLFHKLLSTIIAKNLVGGEVCALISEELSSGTSILTREILKNLENAVLSNFYRILFPWIHNGVLLYDMSFEFMVWDLSKLSSYNLESKKIIGIEEGFIGEHFKPFDKHFCVIKDLCPPQFLNCLKDIILCGIYSLIAREVSDREICMDKSLELDRLSKGDDSNSYDSEEILRYVKAMRADISRQLFEYLKEKHSLREILELIRRFVFVDSSDCMVTFIEMVEDSLDCVAESLSIQKMNIVFQEAINKSTFSLNQNMKIFKPFIYETDVFSLLCHLDKTNLNRLRGSAGISSEISDKRSSLAENHFGIEFDMNPLLSIAFHSSFVLLSKTFYRIMFLMHRAIHILSGKCSANDLIGEERYLIENMLHTVKVYVSHCSYYTLPQLWDEFIENFNKAKDLETILDLQSLFFKKMMTNCFLVDPQFVLILSDIYTLIATDFNDYSRAADFWKNLRQRLIEFFKQPNENISYSIMKTRLYSSIY